MPTVAPICFNIIKTKKVIALAISFEIFIVLRTIKDLYFFKIRSILKKYLVATALQQILYALFKMHFKFTFYSKNYINIIGIM